MESGADTIKDLAVGDTLYFLNASRTDVLSHTEIYDDGRNTYIVFDGGGYLTGKTCTNVSLVRSAIQGSLTINQWNDF